MNNMKRRVNHRGSRNRQKQESLSQHQVSEDSQRSSFRAVVVLLVCMVTALVVLYFILPTKYTGPRRHKEPQETSADDQDHRHHDDHQSSTDPNYHTPCQTLLSQAKEVVDTKPISEWEYSLDLLATCALQEPDNSEPRWNLAVILIKLNRVEEAIDFIDQALILDPNNKEYLRGAGTLLSHIGMHSEVIRCLEGYLEVALGVSSWEKLLASISIQREDEWMFLYEAGDDVVDVFELLQSSYLHEMSLIKAGYLYKVIIGLKGEEVEMHLLLSYSFFAFGLGDVATGIKYLRLHTERQYMLEGYGDQGQAYEVVTAHSLRLLTAGFDSQLINIGKNLLMGGDLVWDELVYNCELKPNDRFSFSNSVSLLHLRKIFIRCVVLQKVIENLIQEGGVVYAENLFGWTPLLHAVGLGSSEIVSVLLENKADPLSRTILAHTSLHVAAMRGTSSSTPLITQGGLRLNEVDYFNRTALHISCLHGWSAKGMADILGMQLPSGCPHKPIYLPPPKLSTYGGWLPSGWTLPKRLTEERCDFDVISHSDIQTFVFDYLSLQRPVLIRNATNIHIMKRLHQLWQRNKFEHEYGGLVFNEVEIPYAESFGYTTSQKTSAKAFMTKIKQFQEDYQHLPLDTVPSPTYIFETVSPGSVLLQELRDIPILDENITHISPLKTQFYLGPPLSGAPVHFHRNAWNVLIYGQKRWFLYPPDKAYYSKEPVWSWWRTRYSLSPPDALECVQHPGDLMFVPDMWGHAVINLRESVGVASEFVYGSSEFSI